MAKRKRRSKDTAMWIWCFLSSEIHLSLVCVLVKCGTIPPILPTWPNVWVEHVFVFNECLMIQLTFMNNTIVLCHYISQTDSHYHHQEFSTCSTIKKNKRSNEITLYVCISSGSSYRELYQHHKQNGIGSSRGIISMLSRCDPMRSDVHKKQQHEDTRFENDEKKNTLFGY